VELAIYFDVADFDSGFGPSEFEYLVVVEF
jgi:hypothetical protein